MEPRNGKSLSTYPVGGDRGRAGAGAPAETMEVGTDLRSEVVALRREFANSMAALRGSLAESDGDLHEMQLASLRRQISQLEGVLESNYQRELRSAEERESALRAEMAQMRQDLRVALETLYRMPGESAPVAPVQDDSGLLERLAELKSALLSAANEREQAALERESSLKTELAHMRRDLLVTLEASYQLPGDRTDALDSQLAAWRGEIDELQRLIVSAHGKQEAAATEQQAAWRARVDELVGRLENAFADSSPHALRDELTAQQELLAQLNDRLGEQISAERERAERLSGTLAAGSAALEHRMSELGADLRSTTHAVSGLAAQQEQLARVENRVGEQVAAEREHAERIARAVTDGRAALEERLGALGAEVISAVEGLAVRAETAPMEAQPELLQSVLARIEELHAALAESQAGRAQQTEARDETLAGLGASLSSLAYALDQSRAEQRAGLDAHLSVLRDELAATRRDLLESVSADREAPAAHPPLTAEELGAAVGELLVASESRAIAAQEAEYRHLASQLGELQGDFDLLRTEIQALQPIESDPPAPQGEALGELHAILDELRSGTFAVQPATPAAGTAEAGPASTFDPSGIESALADVRDAVVRLTPASGGELADQLDQLRLELLASVETLRPVPALQPPEEGDGNELSARLEQLEASIQQQGEEQRAWLTERERATAVELEQLRATLHELPAAASAPASDDEWRREISELRAEFAALAGLMEPTSESPTVDIVEELRSELRAALRELSPAPPAAEAAPQDVEGLRGELTQLSTVLAETRAEQARIVEAQQTLLQSALDGMRADLKTALEAVNRDNLDSFEKRQAQLRLDQIEMERSLSKLRQELVTNKNDAGKKKLWH